MVRVVLVLIFRAKQQENSSESKKNNNSAPTPMVFRTTTRESSTGGPKSRQDNHKTELFFGFPLVLILVKSLYCEKIKEASGLPQEPIVTSLNFE